MKYILGCEEFPIRFRKHLLRFVSAFALMDWMRNPKYSLGCLRDSWEIPYFVSKPQEWKLGEFVFVEKALKDIIPISEIPNFISRYNTTDAHACYSYFERSIL
jgi:hypothetical protein